MRLCQSTSENYPEKSVCLYSVQKDYVNIYVEAEIKGGCLKIIGRESSTGNEDVLYDSLFEFRYSFNTENTLKLWEALAKTAPLLDLVSEKFRGVYGCGRLRDFCKEKAIQYSFTSCASYD